MDEDETVKDGGEIRNPLPELQAEQTEPGPAAEKPAGEKDGAAQLAALRREYPECVKGDKAELPPDALALYKSGLGLLEACRAADLARTKKLCQSLEARLDAATASRAAAGASIGSLSGGAPQKDFYTSEEWDGLSKREKAGFIKSGKIYEFMRKWSGKR